MCIHSTWRGRAANFTLIIIYKFVSFISIVQCTYNKVIKIFEIVYWMHFTIVENSLSVFAFRRKSFYCYLFIYFFFWLNIIHRHTLLVLYYYKVRFYIRIILLSSYTRGAHPSKKKKTVNFLFMLIILYIMHFSKLEKDHFYRQD